jgi:(1->4)-alpha-D-glucan 1-alpha-D-glucosylmutase
LPASGERAAHVIAFTRSDATTGEGDLVVAVPRLVSGFLGEAVWSGEAFAGTHLSVTPGSTWTDLVTGDAVVSDDGRIELGRAFARLPYAVLKRTG